MKIAITGTIGSGKTVVSDYLRNKGLYVFDCDKYNSFLIENDKVTIDKIYINFPECFDQHAIDKKRLAEVIFDDNKKRLVLESILHPLIIKKMNDESKKHDIFFAEVPLLFEKGLQNNFDITILIVSDQKLSYERLALKGYSLDEIKSRELSQLPVDKKLKMADEIIYNNGSCKDLFKEIDKLLIKYDWK